MSGDTKGCSRGTRYPEVTFVSLHTTGSGSGMVSRPRPGCSRLHSASMWKAEQSKNIAHNLVKVVHSCGPLAFRLAAGMEFAFSFLWFHGSHAGSIFSSPAKFDFLSGVRVYSYLRHVPSANELCRQVWMQYWKSYTNRTPWAI